jgi:putative methyltransferase (TIGR04325 family)
MVKIFNKIKGVFNFKKKIINYLNWSGDYISWNDALRCCDGFDSELILNKCASSLIEVKHGRRAYERDSVLFDEIQHSLGLIIGMLCAMNKSDNKLSVLDFGGSLGSSYFQNKDLTFFNELNWSIIEQPHFVDYGRVNFEDNKLNFFYSVEEALSRGPHEIVLLSSVLQYIEDYVKVIKSISETSASYILIDRTPIINGSKSRIVKQVVPEEIYPTSYPMHIFEYEELISHFVDYDVVFDFYSYCDPHFLTLEDGISVSWKGILLKLKG